MHEVTVAVDEHGEFEPNPNINNAWFYFYRGGDGTVYGGAEGEEARVFDTGEELGNYVVGYLEKFTTPVSGT